MACFLQNPDGFCAWIPVVFLGQIQCESRAYIYIFINGGLEGFPAWKVMVSYDFRILCKCYLSKVPVHRWQMS